MRHRNSRRAFVEEYHRLNKRSRLIMDNVLQVGAGTDRAIMQRMGYSDMNSVRPRITELVGKGLLSELRTTLDPQTNRTVRVVGYSDN